MVDKTTYVFIDGSYVREAIDRAMKVVYGVPGDMAPDAIVPPDAFRAYFYDCVDDLKRQGETEAEFCARVEAQEARFSRMRARPGLHVRLGTLTGERRRRQKEVDILLAVDMLSHGFNHNMTHAILVTGDLDFRPVVETLVRNGVFVYVWYEKQSGAKELYWASDFGSEINWFQLHNWNTEDFKLAHPIPRQTMAHPPVTGSAFSRAGMYKGRHVAMLRASAQDPLILRAEMSDGVHWFEHRDQQVLDRFFTMLHGSIEWT
jgi:hypothetical protein